MAEVALVALAVEAAVGYPDGLYRRIRHPVDWMAAAIRAMERRWNRPERSEAARRAGGIVVVLVLCCIVGGTAWAVEQAALAALGRQASFVVVAVLASVGLAQRSLYSHVVAVACPLTSGDLASARNAVAAIVGRDTDHLDASGVARAAVESLAESFCDGVAAPALWLAAGGLPGLFVYKMVNTADSLIGHKEQRWRAFGWAAARTDDAMNLVPARLAGALICLAGGHGWRAMVRQAPRHASPNAGWPEAAMAAALGAELGGPVRYDGVPTARPLFGEGGTAPDAEALWRALAIYRCACALLWLFVGGLAWVL